MSDSNMIPLNKPEASDPLESILKQGAQQLLAQAVEAEITIICSGRSRLKAKQSLCVMVICRNRCFST